jgi:pimeloyl-ACP methyl ester carboxylesterase
MRAVFVHGVPDTQRLWDRIRERLSRHDTTALELPGFGAHRPPGFTSSKEAYVDFAIEQIEGVGEPVHLVGHDWGAILVQRIVALRPDLIRSWAAGSGIVDTEYTWHDLAQQWQTPGGGEQLMEMMTPGILATTMESAGVPADAAAEMARRFDAEMKDSILRLYRSAASIGTEWQPDMERVTRPALIRWGADDPFADVPFARRLAERVHGELLVLPGCGHWWPVERPAEVAVALERFWSTTD